MRNTILLLALLFICQFAMASGNQWTGTGFALKDRYIITNHHVVDGARTLKVRGINGDFTKMYNAVVVAKDAAHDMAIIRIEDDKFNGFGDIPYTLKSELSEVGEDIFVLGYPLMGTMGEEVKLTTGVISSRSGFQGDVSAYQISAPIQPGNSGGPLFDSNGDIIGIVNAKHGQADNAGYAIKSPYMRLFIQNSLNPSIIPSNRKMIDMSLPNKVKTAKTFIFIIYASTNEGVDFATHIQPSVLPESHYKIGDIISINGTEGIVFEVTDGGKHGKVISVKESSERMWWISDKNEYGKLIGANNEHNGMCNMAIVKQIPNWYYKYPVFRWCADLGEGWYLPAESELLDVCKVKDVVNKTLQSKNEPILHGNWSSTEANGRYICFPYADGTRDHCMKYCRKHEGYYVRAVCVF